MGKQTITIRLDEEIIAFYKSKGNKYQAEINQVLLKTINNITIEYIAQLIYTSVKKAKNRFKSVQEALAKYDHYIEENELRVTTRDIVKASCIFLELFPDVIFDDENLFFNQDAYQKVLHYILILNEIGLLVATDIYGDNLLSESKNNFATLMAFLKIDYAKFKEYIYNELNTFVEIYSRKELDEQLFEWKEDSEILGKSIWAKNNLTLCTDPLDETCSEIYNRYKSLISINSFSMFSSSNQKKDKEIANYIYGIFLYLTILYTRAYQNIKNEHCNLNLEAVFPQLEIFMFMVSDKIKLTKELGKEINQELSWIRYSGYNGDLSVFELNTKHETIDHFDEFGNIKYSSKYYDDSIFQINDLDEEDSGLKIITKLSNLPKLKDLRVLFPEENSL
jgi:hypothetical protein